MRPQLYPLCTLALLAAALAPAQSQQFQPRNFEFKGAPEFSDAELTAAAGLKQGETLTSDEMNQHAKRLMDSGVFDSLSYKFDGQDMIFALAPATLYPVRIDNLPIQKGPELEAKLHARIPLYHGKVPSQGTLLDQVCSVLEEILKAQGITAKVAAQPYSDPKTRSQVSAIAFSIVSPPIYIGEVRYIGVSMDVASQLRSIAAAQALQPFATDHSAANLQLSFATLYQNLGYAAAIVDIEPDGKPKISPTAIRIPYVAKIKEGRIYKIGTIQVPPDLLVTQQEVDKAVSGQNSADNGEKLQAVRTLLNDRYHAKGYLDFSYTVHARLDEASDTVNYAVIPSPGPVYHLGLIRFETGDEALRARLMRDWQMLPGDPFNSVYLDGFLAKAEVKDPGLREALANLLARYDMRTDPTTHEVNLVIHLENQ